MIGAFTYVLCLGNSETLLWFPRCFVSFMVEDRNQVCFNWILLLFRRWKKLNFWKISLKVGKWLHFLAATFNDKCIPIHLFKMDLLTQWRFSPCSWYWPTPPTWFVVDDMSQSRNQFVTATSVSSAPRCPNASIVGFLWMSKMICEVWWKALGGDQKSTMALILEKFTHF